MSLELFVEFEGFENKSLTSSSKDFEIDWLYSLTIASVYLFSPLKKLDTVVLLHIANKGTFKFTAPKEIGAFV